MEQLLDGGLVDSGGGDNAAGELNPFVRDARLQCAYEVGQATVTFDESATDAATNWRREENSSPFLLAKCTHDVDWLSFIIGSRPVVQSWQWMTSCGVCAAMVLAAEPLANFIDRNPTVVMLALGFLLMIGAVLIADGFGVHVPKGYIYAAMGFSVLVEALNIMSRRAQQRKQGRSAPPS